MPERCAATPTVCRALYERKGISRGLLVDQKKPLCRGIPHFSFRLQQFEEGTGRLVSRPECLAPFPVHRSARGRCDRRRDGVASFIGALLAGATLHPLDKGEFRIHLHGVMSTATRADALFLLKRGSA